MAARVHVPVQSNPRVSFSTATTAAAADGIIVGDFRAIDQPLDAVLVLERFCGACTHPNGALFLDKGVPSRFQFGFLLFHPFTELH
jgi:hypothetical protein